MQWIDRLPFSWGLRKLRKISESKTSLEEKKNSKETRTSAKKEWPTWRNITQRNMENACVGSQVWWYSEQFQISDWLIGLVNENGYFEQETSMTEVENRFKVPEYLYWQEWCFNMFVSVLCACIISQNLLPDSWHSERPEILYLEISTLFLLVVIV